METIASAKNRQCRQCGTCCRKGGPALHQEDKAILLEGHIAHAQLVTVRKGEPAINPVSGKLEPVGQELIKLAGKGKEWECCFFESHENSCAIYPHRPLECRLLQCWDTEAVVAVIGRDTMTRFDMINADDPVRDIIAEHERQCPYYLVTELAATLPSEKGDAERVLAQLTELVRKDLAIRSHALHRLGVPDAAELFLFGRPLFKTLAHFGITAYESSGDIKLHRRPHRVE